MAAVKRPGMKKTLKMKSLSGKGARSVKGGTLIDGVAGESIDVRHSPTIEDYGSITRKK